MFTSILTALRVLHKDITTSRRASSRLPAVSTVLRDEPAAFLIFFYIVHRNRPGYQKKTAKFSNKAFCFLNTLFNWFCPWYLKRNNGVEVFTHFKLLAE
jgi:hypothetical protein